MILYNIFDEVIYISFNSFFFRPEVQTMIKEAEARAPRSVVKGQFKMPTDYYPFSG